MRAARVYLKTYSSGERSVCTHSLRDAGSLFPLCSKRGVITEWSQQSRTRLRRYCENAITQYRVMVTLTYSSNYPTDGRIFKSHLDQFGKNLVAHGLMPSSVLWVMEYQKRGAPHYHLFIPSFIPWQAVQWCWKWAGGEYVSLGSGSSCQAVDNARYALKYARKECQKKVPQWIKHPGRFWGIWGNREMKPLTEAFRVDTDAEMAPLEVQMERASDIKAGRVIYDHEYGFLSYPPRQKVKHGQ